MKDEANRCPQCQAPLPTDGAHGLCPKCLLARAAIPTETGQLHPVSPPPLDAISAAFPHLEIIELIGQGGMGFVFKARQPKLDRLVALKILPQSLAADPAFAERFNREARLLAKLNHQSIVTVYDFGQAGEFFYLLMEYVDGVNLRQAMRAGRFTQDEALAIVPRICEALQFAHNEGILHRDIKPENILLDSKGRVKIADFGIAKLIVDSAHLTELSAIPVPSSPDLLTETGKTLGTPDYMAPEQVADPQNVDQRADIYSLGVVFYEMLTGELPARQFVPPSEKTSADPRVDEVVARALERQKEKRFTSAEEVKTRVETIATTIDKQHESPSRPRFFGQISTFDKYLILFALGMLLVFAVSRMLSVEPGPPEISKDELDRKERKYLILPPNSAPIATNAPSTNSKRSPAAQSSWSPDLSSGQKADVNKILHEATELTKKEKYPEALQRFLWCQKTTDLEPNHNGAFPYYDWVELGRRYPQAKQALIEVRDSKTRTFKEGRGYYDLFTQVLAINRELQDNGSTVALFKSIHASDPDLSRQCFFSAGRLLAEQGEYELCLICIGDPQERLEFFRRSWSSQSLPERQMLVPPARSVPAPLPRLPTRKELAEGSFVSEACFIIEVLVATEHKPEAGKIRDSALKSLVAPKLRTAVEDAELRVKNNLAARSAPPRPSIRELLKAYTNSIRAEAATERWSPDLSPGKKLDSFELGQSARGLMQDGRYEEALQRFIWLNNHSAECDDNIGGLRLTHWLSDWRELGRRYPKAKQALIEIRDAKMREFALERGYSALFSELASINKYLQSEDVTYSLFKAIEKSDPALARQCYFYAEDLLVSKRDYDACLRGMGDPQSRFDLIKAAWEMQTRFPHVPVPPNEPASAMPQRPRRLGSVPPPAAVGDTTEADKRFVTQVRQLIEILVGAGRRSDAEHIRDQALALVNDDAITSAIADADKKL